jgi:TRAP-type C4-dicarboxylate transport system permease large subunit
MDPFAANSLVWPLAFILVALLVLRQLRNRFEPITSGVVAGLSKHARIHALAYGLAFLLALNACLDELTETFAELTREQLVAMAWWQVGALVAGCFSPAVATVIALVVKSPLQPGQEPKEEPKP